MTDDPTDLTAVKRNAMLDRLERVADWIQPAVEQYLTGTPVHVAFSPGDATCYGMVFTPPNMGRLATPGDFPRVPVDDAVLALLYPEAKATVVAYQGNPWPNYVASHLGVSNPYTIAAVGVCWWLMAGNDFGQAAIAYQELGDVIRSWTHP